MPRFQLRAFASNERLHTLGFYSGAALLSILILVGVLKLWKADLTVPFNYVGDGILHAAYIKGTIENGWYWHNSFIGMPTGLELYDYPAIDNLQFLLIKGLSLLRPEHAWVLNIFFLLTFPLTTLTSLYVFRRFNLSYVVSLFASLLYTFSPYHFLRNEGHLFLSAYYILPFVIMVAIWIASGELLSRDESKGWHLHKANVIFSTVVCVLIGSSGIYYPFFSCFFLIVAGVSASIYWKNLRHILVSLSLAGLIFTVLLINLSPSLAYVYKNGDTQITQRGPAEAEYYGMRIAQMLLPISGHRIGVFNAVKRRYNEGPLMTENDSASLGAAGSIGFLMLLGWLFYRKPIASKTNLDRTHVLLDHLSVLNLSALLLATIGGFGSIFALLVSARIRTYNRISIFIGFISLFALALVLEGTYQRRAKSARARTVFYVFISFFLVAALLDQTSKHYVPDYQGIKAEYGNDAAFVSRIESSLPANSMIFQLPYAPFPEYPSVNQMKVYDHFRGYLHSKALRWSYGAMKGREGDSWQKRVSSLPVGELVLKLAFAGFNGIYIDRYGYADKGAQIESEIAHTLGSEPFISGDGRLVFFNTTEFNKRLKEGFNEQDWQVKQDLTLHPLDLSWQGGFSDLEVGPGKAWRWCSSEGELHIDNKSRRTRKVEFQMSFSSGQQEYSDLLISSPLISEKLRINAAPSAYAKTINVPPGHHVVKFVCNARRVDAPLDPRNLVFRIENFNVKEQE
jgi:phosphoglycerol transferase